MRRTTLAVALATGALTVPAVAWAAGGDDTTTPTRPTQSTAPVQQEQRQPRESPDGKPCPEGHQGGSPEGSEAPEGSGGSSQTQL
jgi:hypothetical protein